MVVTGPDQEAIAEILPVGCERAVQQERLGTGDAVRAGLLPLAGFDGDVMVLYGDVPLVHGDFVAGLFQRHLDADAAATLTTVRLDDPAHYGRIVRDADDRVARIVEYRDASAGRARDRRDQRRPLRLPQRRPAPGAGAPRQRQRPGRALPHRRRAPAHRRRAHRRHLRERRRGDVHGRQLARRAGHRQRRHALAAARASHARRRHRRGPRHDLRGLGRRGGPRHADPRQHAPARAHDRGRCQRDRPRLVPARRLRRRPRPRRELAPVRVRHQLRLQRRSRSPTSAPTRCSPRAPRRAPSSRSRTAASARAARCRT